MSGGARPPAAAQAVRGTPAADETPADESAADKTPLHKTPLHKTPLHKTPAENPRTQAKPGAAQGAPRPDAARAPSLADLTARYPATVDIEAVSVNAARLVEESNRALAAALTAPGRTVGYDAGVADAVKTLCRVAQFWYADPQRSLEAQTRLGQGFLDLFTSMSRRMAGAEAPPAVEPDPRDKRFADPEWSSNQYFDFVKQAYLIIAEWSKYLVDHADGLDETVRLRAEFYVRQLVNALAPSNCLFTNPELLRATLSRNAENLAAGARMLAEDIEAGGGDLKIRQSDTTAFEVGRNLATTPGKVVYQNALMQLIQYAPATPHVLKRPLLLVPPWINKFYVLDLTPEKSFIRWCVDRGLTVFVISWVNPDERLRDKGFADYMREGPLRALDLIAAITGETEVSTIGYCVGGTLLAFTLAYMAGRQDRRIAAATLLTTQVDFTHAGDLKVFAATEDQVRAIEHQMAGRGYLEGSKMATAFNLLRSNELVWPYVIKNYLKGEAPLAFDLLYWNADATRMPAANHSYYLRNCYLENNLAKGTLSVDGVAIDLKRVTIPLYNLATREDHIAPAKSVFIGSSCFGGPVRYVLSGSGHIAGVVNPPAKQKYQYWTGEPPRGDDLDGWLGRASMHPGSWWLDWCAWNKAQAPLEVAAREPGGGKIAPIEDAPGSYVLARG